MRPSVSKGDFKCLAADPFHARAFNRALNQRFGRGLHRSGASDAERQEVGEHQNGDSRNPLRLNATPPTPGLARYSKPNVGASDELGACGSGCWVMP